MMYLTFKKYTTDRSNSLVGGVVIHLIAQCGQVLKAWSSASSVTLDSHGKCGSYKGTRSGTPKLRKHATTFFLGDFLQHLLLEKLQTIHFWRGSHNHLRCKVLTCICKSGLQHQMPIHLFGDPPKNRDVFKMRLLGPEDGIICQPRTDSESRPFQQRNWSC